jgi:hypothetical protein
VADGRKAAAAERKADRDAKAKDAVMYQCEQNSLVGGVKGVIRNMGDEGFYRLLSVESISEIEEMLNLALAQAWQANPAHAQHFRAPGDCRNGRELNAFATYPHKV